MKKMFGYKKLDEFLFTGVFNFIIIENKKTKSERMQQEDNDHKEISDTTKIDDYIVINEQKE